uniref:DUF4590 domain-containing protein n=1 Tax=Melopsittacus undulatus TaxID=13146 RepID=A0A8V5G0W7_MELUD
MQHPPCLQPLRSSAAEGSLPKTSGSSHRCHVLKCVKQFVIRQERSGSRVLNSVKCVTGVSPYQLPAINNYVMPVPPPRLQKKSLNAERNGMPRGRQFHLATAPSDAEQPPKKPAGGFSRSPLRSNACVTMIFLGKIVNLSHDDADCRDEIKVYQQHCGGENLCVYKGRLMAGETFQFISKRHRGFPFSLTFFLNGIQVDRLSCCCEYKHQKRSRLGGRHGSFAILHVEGASPCYRCIIAMGLDKEPSPPKRKVEEDHEEKYVGFWGDGACSEPSKSRVEQKSRRNSVLVILPSHGATMETAGGEMKTKWEYGKEEMKKPADREREDRQEDTIKNEYDEDFEADEEVNEEGQTNDQMNGMSKSPSDDKNHNLDYENESKTSSQKELQASDSEEDESDGYSDSSSEDDEQGGRQVHSFSSVSTQYSSEDDSCAETTKDDVEGKEECNDERASDAQSEAHAQSGNENGDNKLHRVEENQEISVLEKEGIDEAEKAKPDLTASGDTGIFHENTTTIQHQSPEVNRELDQVASVQSDTGEDEENTSTGRGDGEEGVLVPLESSVTEVEDSNDEASCSDEGGVFDDCNSAQAEMAKAAGNDHHGNSGPELGDSDVNEEEEHIMSAEHDASEAPDASSLAEEAITLDKQKATKQVVQDGQMEGEKQALEEEEFVAEGGDAQSKEAEEVPQVGDLLPKEDTVAVLLMESLLAVQESAPEENTQAEGDPKGQETWKGAETGAELKASGEELAQKGKTATPELGEALEVEGSSFLRVEDTVEESVEPGKGPLLQEAPALEALVGAGGDPLSEGSLRLEETSAAEEEEGSAEAVLCGNPSPGSKAKMEGAVEGKADGGVGTACVQGGRAEPRAGEEGTGRAADPGERADGMEGPPGCAEGTGKAQPAGDGAVEGAALSAPGRGVSAVGTAGQEGTADGADALSSPQQQRAHPGTGAEGSRDGAEQAAGGAQREQSGLHGGAALGAAVPVPASAQSPAGAGEQGTDSPAGGSPNTPGAADEGERSHSPCEEPAVPDTAVVPPVQPQLGKESCL